ncbi:MAG TPA: DNA-3-methyladenine glycosylase 2 family protein, partial [Methylomirabilota bacterium]|nr:DNA-3-methyladenine glycosylase 2 family protein [Methylomirabilota bacterium]
ESPEAIRIARERDPKMGNLIERIGAFRMRLDRAATPFAALTESIIYQQITGRAAETIAGRLRDRLGEGRFPAPERVLEAPDALLREAGLSRGKVAALRDLAAKSLDGTVPGMARLRTMEDEEIVERLMVVRGIGRWTAEMFLMFRLGRPDVLPIDDYGVRKGFKLAFGRREMPKPKSVALRGERWRPYRTVASWYLWRALE